MSFSGDDAEKGGSEVAGPSGALDGGAFAVLEGLAGLFGDEPGAGVLGTSALGAADTGGITCARGPATGGAACSEALSGACGSGSEGSTIGVAGGENALEGSDVGATAA